MIRDHPAAHIRDNPHTPRGKLPSQHTAQRGETPLINEVRAKLGGVDEIGLARAQTLAQLALAWTLRDPRMTSAPRRRLERRATRGRGGVAAERRGASRARRTRELREWKAAHPNTVTDPGLFTREILPLIERLPLSDLVRATGLTRGYLSQIRRGMKIPHPKHWPRLLDVAT
jgi:hypothetical protein